MRKQLRHVCGVCGTHSKVKKVGGLWICDHCRYGDRGGKAVGDYRRKIVEPKDMNSKIFKKEGDDGG